MQLRLVGIIALFVVLGGAIFYLTQPASEVESEPAQTAQPAPDRVAVEPAPPSEPIEVERVMEVEGEPVHEGPYRVHGRVVDGRTQEPIPGAAVTATNPGDDLPERAEVDAAGAFDLTVRADQGRLLVRAEGYALTRVPLPNPLTEDFELEISLRPGTSVAGKVVEKGTGAPVEGIKVAAIPADASLANLRRERPGESPRRAEDATDEAGQFLLTGLEAGTYRVVVEARQAGYLFSSDMAEVLRLEEGDSAEDVWFELERGAVVVGVVRGPDGQPVAKAEVEAIPKDAMSAMLRGMETQDLEVFAQVSVETDADGRFELPGLAFETEYRLHGNADGFAPTPSDAFMIPRNQRQASVNLTLIAGATLQGEVALADGTPVSEVPLMLMPSPENMMSGSFSGPMRESSGDAGRFSFDHIPPGTYTLMLRDRSKYRLVEPLELSVDGESLYDGILLVAEERETDPLGEGRITGLVLDTSGRPAPGVTVNARPAFIARGVASAITGTDGRFELETPLPSRRFDLIARTNYGHASLEAVAVGSDVVLELRPPARVSGIVIDSRNHPVPDAEVRLERDTGRAPEDPAEEMMLAMGGMMGPGDGAQRSEVNGHFHFTDVGPGEYTVHAKHQSMGVGESYKFTVSEGQDLTNVQVRLEPGVVFAGRVQDKYGQPVSGAFVRMTPIGTGGEVEQMMATLMPMGSGPNTISSASQRDGRFELNNVFPGEYLIETTHARFAKTVQRGVTVSRGANVRDHTITMTEGGTARGRYAPGGQPQAGAMILVLGESGMQMATTAFDGSFSVDNLPAGEYMMFPMRFDANDPGDFLDLLNNGRVFDLADGDMADVDFDTPPGGQPFTGTVNAGPDTITVISLRRPGGPDPATINPMNMLQAMRALRYQVAVGMAEPDGTFNLNSVPPGEYILDAVTLDASVMNNPDPSLLFNLDRFPRITQNVTVGSGPVSLDLQF